MELLEEKLLNTGLFGGCMALNISWKQQGAESDTCIRGRVQLR